MGVLEANTTLIYGVHIRESANDGSDFSNAAADYRVLFLGEDGKLHVKDSAGAVTDAYSTSGVANLWTMSNGGSSQTLTNNTPTLVTFDTAQIDGGSSCIDLANDKFETPATGFYLAHATWLWEGTAPGASANMSVRVAGTDAASLVRTQATNAVNGGLHGTFPLSLTAGDNVELYINPGAVTGVTARGNASVHLRTSFTLQRIT